MVCTVLSNDSNVVCEREFDYSNKMVVSFREMLVVRKRSELIEGFQTTTNNEALPTIPSTS
jgi:hypothetical protein